MFRRVTSPAWGLPATVQATIAAASTGWIRRPNAASAAAVIGAKFSCDLFQTLVSNRRLEELARGQFIDQVAAHANMDTAGILCSPPAVRAVAYESQLKSDRAELHRRLAAAIEQRDPASAEARRADSRTPGGGRRFARLHDWHMRAGRWSTFRDIGAARPTAASPKIADQLQRPQTGGDADRAAHLLGSAYRIGGTVADTGFDELRDQIAAAGDKSSLAIGMTGF